MTRGFFLPLALLCCSLLPAANNDHWVVTWGASPSPQGDAEQMRTAKLTYDKQTLREIVHTSLGGKSVRVRLSNAFGKDEALIGGAHIALSATGGAIVPGSDRVLLFSGRPTATIPPDGFVISDPLSFDLPASGNIAISLFLPKATTAGGIHYSSQQTTYIGAGDQTRTPEMANAEKLESWVFLGDVDVLAPRQAGTIVAFGDSITDGARSMVDANHRWPNLLADRLQAKRDAKVWGVLDAGIGGNRILHDAVGNVRFGLNALARFDRDVLAQPGLKYVIVLEGINDLGHAGSSAPASETVSADDLIAGLKQMAERTHENGAKIIGATLTPFTGTTFKDYFTPEKEAKRKKINDWIRTSGTFDGVIDFEKATQDPAHPDHLLPAYDSGDHLHPNDAGYKAMADSIDLSLFRRTTH